MVATPQCLQKLICMASAVNADH